MDHNSNSESPPEIQLRRARDEFPRKEWNDLNDPFEYRGEVKTIREWAEKLGVTPKAILLRYARYAAGKIDKDKLMAPGQPKTSQPKTEQGQIKDGFYSNFVKHVLPKLGEEMRVYMRSGEQGPGLKMLKDFAKFIPVSADEAVAESNRAIWAVVFRAGDPDTNRPAELPEHYEPIDD